MNVGGNLDVDGDTTLDTTNIDGTLTVNGNITVTGTSNITATSFTGQASAATQITTQSRSTNANHFITFVDSNNGTAANESLYTDAGIFFNPSSNNLSVTGDITAFASDDRLKTNRVALTDALEKVCSLNGFTYNFNETAGELGFNTELDYVGVSAQEVQEVLPEAVRPAPVGSDYITVQYEKVVPLLIEAIKELSDKVSALEEKLNK